MSRILLIGDSTVYSRGANPSGTAGVVGAHVNSIARQLASELTSLGVTAESKSIVGMGGNNNASSTELYYNATPDVDVALNGWDNLSFDSIGGDLYRSNAAGEILTFTFDNVDSIVIGFPVRTYRDVRYRVDSGAWTTVSLTGADNLLREEITGLTLGSHTVEIEPAGTGTANSYVVYCEPLNSASDVVIIPWGARGYDSSQLNDTTRPWSYRSALEHVPFDLAIIKIGINDVRTGGSGTTEADYIANVTAYVQAAQAQNPSLGVILQIPNDIDSGLSFVPTALAAIAASENVTLVDTRQSVGMADYATANANGLMYDNLHPNNLGYQAEAEYIAPILRDALTPTIINPLYTDLATTLDTIDRSFLVPDRDMVEDASLFFDYRHRIDNQSKAYLVTSEISRLNNAISMADHVLQLRDDNYSTAGNNIFLAGEIEYRKGPSPYRGTTNPVPAYSRSFTDTANNGNPEVIGRTIDLLLTSRIVDALAEIVYAIFVASPTGSFSPTAGSSTALITGTYQEVAQYLMQQIDIMLNVFDEQWSEDYVGRIGPSSTGSNWEATGYTFATRINVNGSNSVDSDNFRAWNHVAGMMSAALIINRFGGYQPNALTRFYKWSDFHKSIYETTNPGLSNITAPTLGVQPNGSVVWNYVAHRTTSEDGDHTEITISVYDVAHRLGIFDSSVIDPLYLALEGFYQPPTFSAIYDRMNDPDLGNYGGDTFGPRVIGRANWYAPQNTNLINYFVETMNATRPSGTLGNREESSVLATQMSNQVPAITYTDVIFDGTIPDPATTESFHEMILQRHGVTLVSGNTIHYSADSNTTVATDSTVSLSPEFVSGFYAYTVNGVRSETYAFGVQDFFQAPISATSVESASSVSSATITQSHVLAANDFSASSSVTATSLAQGHALLSNSVGLLSQTSSATISQISALLSDSVESNSETSANQIVQGQALSATSVQSINELTSPSISINSADSNLSADDTESASQVSASSLNQSHILFAESVISDSEVSDSTIIVSSSFLAESVESLSQVTTPSFFENGRLSADDVESQSEVFSATLNQVHSLNANSIESLSQVMLATLGGSVFYPDISLSLRQEILTANLK